MTVESVEVKPVVLEIAPYAGLLGLFGVERIALFGLQQGNDILFDPGIPRPVVHHITRQSRLQVGQENGLVVPIAATQVGEYLSDGVQTQRSIPLRQTDGGKRFGLLLGQLQLLGCPGLQPLVIAEREEGVPYVVYDLLLGFSCGERVAAAQLGLPLFAKERHQSRSHRATAHVLTSREVERIGRLPAVSFAGVFSLAHNLFGNIFKVEVGLGFAQKQRANSRYLLVVQRSRGSVLRRGDADVVEELPHPELFVPRMRQRTTALAPLEGTVSDLPFLRLEVTLVEYCLFQCLDPLFGQLLFVADGSKLGQVVLVPRGIVIANLLFSLIEVIKIFTQILASGIVHLSGQLLDAAFDLPVLLFVAGLLAVAEEPAPLSQVVERSPQYVPLRLYTKIEPFGQGPITVVVRIFIPIIIGPLPQQKGLIHRVLFSFAPVVQLCIGQGRAEVVGCQYPQQGYLPQPPTEIVSPQSPCIGTVLHGGFFHILFAGNTLLKNIYSFVNQCIIAIL